MTENSYLILAAGLAGALLLTAGWNMTEAQSAPAGPPLKLSAAAEQTEVVMGDWITITLTLTNSSENKIETLKPILDIDSVSLQIKTVLPNGNPGKGFFHSVITPSVYEHNRAQMSRITLEPNDQAQARFKLPAATLGHWEITAHYQGGGRPVSAEPLKIHIMAKGEKTDLKDAKSKEGELIAKIETSKGAMKCRFFFDEAPNTVLNFLRLAKSDFYKNLKFHRIMKGFMIQGGCPQGTGGGNPGYSIKAEFNKNKHLKGVLSMARSTHNDSAGSQFFICLGAAPSLDNKYTAFGELISGHDVLESIGNVRTTPNQSGEVSKPTENVIIKSISFEFKEAPEVK